MPARFVDKRIINSVEELSPMEREQLRVAGKFYDGDDRPVEDRLAGGVVEGDGSLFDTELWKVVDGRDHLYDAWFYMSDSGTFFRAGTTEDVAMVIQCGLECDDPDIRAQLGPAMVEAKLLPPSDASHAEFASMLVAQEGDEAADSKPAKKAAKAPAKKAAKAPAKKAAAPAKKAAAPAKKAAAPAKKAAKAPAKKAAKAPAKKAGKAPAKKAPAKKAAAKRAPAKKPAGKKPAKRR